MKLTELKSGDSIFIDANIFIYHFSGASLECKEFLKTCEETQLKGYTSHAVLAEVCHRLMIMEAVKTSLIQGRQPGAKLQKKPHLVRKLSEYYVQMTNLLSWNIEIIPTPKDLLTQSQIYRSRYGLLTNDSLIPVYMDMAGTQNLASADRMFEDIPQLSLYSPSDIAP
jgi:predicted nucleic acid-binding protein